MKMLERSSDKRRDFQFVSLDDLVPPEHLLRKIEKAVDFNKIYAMVEHLYCEDNGRPAIDPIVLVKLVLLQHLYGIKSLRQTVKEADMNMAYRWFIGYDLYTLVPHFATVSYAFATRFPSELFEEIFAWILEAVVEKGYIKAETIFIDATHIKANANKHKNRKVLAYKTARVYDGILREEIEADREAHGKKPLKDKNADSDVGSGEKQITQSTTDPECGLFHKGEHKVEFAYTTHIACDKNNFVLSCEVTPGNVHDSIVFDEVYDSASEAFPEIQTVAVDAGYKTPWICKKVQQDGRNLSTAYKRPLSKKDFFRSYEYVYDEYYDCVICPNNQVLAYSTTNREGYREFKSDPKVCANCPYLYKCTGSKEKQKLVAKHLWSENIEEAEDFRHTAAGKESYKLRSQTVERVFADAKEKHGMRYTMLRGLDRVRNWVRLKFAAMNLKKLALWAW
jgi:transposase